jgi:hypothetical protein
MVALERANEIRLARAALREQVRAIKDLKASRLEAAGIVAAPPEFAAGMSVASLLCACHRTGPAYVATLMRRASVGQGRQLGELTDRERRALRVGLGAERPPAPPPGPKVPVREWCASCGDTALVGPNSCCPWCSSKTTPLAA